MDDVAPRSFIFDVAFDWNATPNAAHQRPLFIGLVNFIDGSPQIDGLGDITYPPFNAGDFVAFNGFNVTSGADGTSYDIVDGSISFQPLAPNTPDSPLLLQPVVTTGLPNDEGPSVVFTANSRYPVWAPLVSNQEIAHAGTYQFNLSLTIDGPGGTKTFVTDPEIIVQATGGS